MNKKTNKKESKISRKLINVKGIPLLIMFIVISLGIGYSVYGTKLNVTNSVANIRIVKDIRVTDIAVSSKSNSVTATYEDYNVSSISTGIIMPNKTSTITYKVSVTNFGNTKMGIREITGLPSHLTYSIRDYTLGDTICDSSGKCTLGVTKDFYITITYDIGISSLPDPFNALNLNLDFRQMHNVTYKNLSGSFPTEIIDGNTLSVNLGSSTMNLKVTMNNVVLTKGTGYTYTNGTLTVPNVNGDVQIEKLEPTPLATGQNFSAAIKTLANGSSKTYSYNDTAIKTISFFPNGQLPSGYTKASLTALSSTDVSSTKDGSIKAYYDGSGNIYVYSDDAIIANSDSSYMFSTYKGLTNLDVSSLDTGKVVTMFRMFWNSNSLTSLNLNSWDTSKVTSIQSIFENCSGLTSLSIGDWDTSSVTNMIVAFGNCSSLTTLSISSWNTSNVIQMQGLFIGCSGIKTLNLRSWDTSSVTDMSQMFQNCTSLTRVVIVNFNTSNVTNMDSMFQGCKGLTSLSIGGWDTSKVTNMSYMFADCTALTTLNLLKNTFTQVTNYIYMFRNVPSTISVSVSDTTSQSWIQDRLGSGVGTVTVN